MWWSGRYCIYYPCLEIIIYFTIIIGLANWRSYLHSFASISGTPANSTPLQFHGDGVAHFSLLCKRTAYQNLPSKHCPKALIPKLFPNMLGSGRDFIIGLISQKKACENNRSLICDFLLYMYNKGYISSSLHLMRSILIFFSSPSNDFAKDNYLYFSIILFNYQ